MGHGIYLSWMNGLPFSLLKVVTNSELCYSLFVAAVKVSGTANCVYQSIVIRYEFIKGRRDYRSRRKPDLPGR